jgi:bifunctional NMN adenylyltransferase/nudix hydrolase
VDFSSTDEYELLVDEYDFMRTYKKQWQEVPYPVIFTTTDAVVVQSGHILLVKRRSAPGCGLWALPGGFLKYDQPILDSMIRELREETKLRVPERILEGSIKAREVFDAPQRSLRGRTVTHAFYIQLPAGKLSKVKGSSDASSAKWFPLDEAFNMGENLFEDHLFIIKHFLGETE